MVSIDGLPEKRHSTKQLRMKKIKLLNNDPVKFSIITSLNLIGSMNLKEISNFLNKKEPFIIRFIKGYKIKEGDRYNVLKTGLLEDELIEIDIKKTNSGRGKYYQISPIMREVYNLEFREEINQLETNPNVPKGWGVDDIAELRSKFKSIIIQKRGTRHTSDLGHFMINNHANYVKFITRKFMRAVEEIFRMTDAEDEGKDYIPNYADIDDFLHSDLNESQWSVKVSSRKQLNRVYQVVFDFYNTMGNVSREIQIENEIALANGTITEVDLRDQYFYNYTAPLKKL